MTRKRLGLGLLAASMLALGGCGGAVQVEPAADAQNPGCAEIMLRLPEQIGDAERRDTTSQATAVWGDPAVAVLRCGVDVPGPTTTQCVGVNDVDWLSQEEDGRWTFTTYGRTPATQVVVDDSDDSGQSVLTDLTAAISILDAERTCS